MVRQRASQRRATQSAVPTGAIRILLLIVLGCHQQTGDQINGRKIDLPQAPFIGNVGTFAIAQSPLPYLLREPAPV
jgi:hypothetical protein